MLANYKSPLMSRLYAADGTLIDEYVKQRRLYVPLQAIPLKLQNAFIAAEDSSFYKHGGIDFKSIFGAAVNNVIRYKEGKNLVGASTITQQLVKNLLLSNERTLDRKIKEAILSARITKVMSKKKVLEIYLNEIYLGYRSYGVAAAALNYFDKSLNQLSLAEIAFIASLPKSPSSLDPKKNYERALSRRNWVLKRMRQDGFISKTEMELAQAAAIEIKDIAKLNKIEAGSYSETVRKRVVEVFAKENILEDGLLITGTLDPRLQEIGFKALRKGIYNYDRRRGYRGPLKNIAEKKQEHNNDDLNSLIEDIVDAESDVKVLSPNWSEKLAEISVPEEVMSNNWKLAVVMNLGPDQVDIGFSSGETGFILLRDLAWARTINLVIDPETELEKEEFSPEITDPSQVFEVGDVIVVRPSSKFKGRNYLRQIPEVNGALVALNPHDGRVLAMLGGYNDSRVEFNRAVQAVRQPGSIVKPFTYLAALENEFMPTSIVVDDEIRMKKEDGSTWIPQNYSGVFYGPTPLRIGLEKSRNVTTVRLAEMVGLSRVASVFKRYQIDEDPELNYAMILGASETNLLDITKAYAMIANGGKRIYPKFIEKINDSEGKIIFRRVNQDCPNCNYDQEDNIDLLEPPVIADNRETITDARTAYQMVSMLQGVVERGTAWRVKSLKKSLAGKTGTTNDSLDAWFVGFSADLVVGVWIGYDVPRSLGLKETGSTAAVPVFVDFMKEALAGKEARPFMIPEGIKLVKVDRLTGKKPLPTTDKGDIIFEALKEENISKIANEIEQEIGGEVEFNNDEYGSSIY